MDNNPLSKFNIGPQKDELEGRTKKSTLEESGSNTDGKPQLYMMANHNFQVASFLMRDVYMNTCQMHGGQGGARLFSLVNHRDQRHDQLKICPITGRDKKPEAEAGEVVDNKSISHGVP